MSEPTLKPSEKITCPFCELEGTRESFAFGEKLRCGRCHELFRVEFARLAVQHARLVAAAKVLLEESIADNGKSTGARLVALRRGLTEALEDE